MESNSTARIVQGFGYALVGLAIVFSLVSLAFVLHFRKRPIVAMGQPTMLSLICLGALLSSIGLAFHIMIIFSDDLGDRGNSYCKVAIWTLDPGSLLIQTVLACKLYRVSKVMRFRRDQTISAQQVLWWPFLIVMLVFLVPNIVLQALYPEDYQVIESFGHCYASGSKNALVFYILDILIHFSIQVFIFVFAWRLRTTNEEIAESRRIFQLSCFDIGILVLYWVIGLLVGQMNVFGIEQSTAGYINIVSDYVYWFLYVMGSIGFLVVPRMYYVHHEHLHGCLPESVRVQGLGQVHVSMTTITPTITTPPASPGLSPLQAV